MKKRIYIKQWNKIKPYQKGDASGPFYLKVANVLYEELSYYSGNFSELMTSEEFVDFCCFLTAYFEDVISETYIFQAVAKHFKQIYGLELYEFFEDEEYYEDEINLSDLKLLCWIYINLKVEDRYIGFQTGFFEHIAQSAYTIFDEYWEGAPMNGTLKAFYTFKATNDYYQIREYIKRLFLDSYLFKHDTELELEDRIDTMVSDCDEKNINIVNYILNTEADKMTINGKSKILALSGKELLAHYVGKEHKNHQDILTLSERVEGNFLYKNKDSRYIYLEFIASGHPVKLLKGSYDNHGALFDDCILYMGMVKWQGDWWFSGNSFITPFDANLILDEKSNIPARRNGNILEDQTKFQQAIDLQRKAFLELNKNNPLAFLKGNEVNGFLKQFNDYINDKAQLSEKEKEASKKKAKQDGYLKEGEENNFNYSKSDRVVLYFNPKSGLEMGINLCAAFPERNNPFFNKEEMDENFETILFSEDLSTEMASYLIARHKDRYTFAKNRTTEEIDMVMRFFKQNMYFSKPQMAFTGK